MDNVLFSKTAGSEVAAVLDWELSTLGDGLADLSYVSVSGGLRWLRFCYSIVCLRRSNEYVPSFIDVLVLPFLSQQRVYERSRWGGSGS